VNKAASLSVYTDRHLLGARERKNEIVGTIAEPRKGSRWRAILRNLTYGGRRGAAPHKHGARARRTSTVQAFWVVLEDGTWTTPFTVILPEGKEAIALFSAEEEAMMFCHLSKQGAKGSVRQTTAGGVLSLLYGPWAVARHVALDPFPEGLGGRLLGLLTLDREHFARSFAGGG
jgi:hypothetical protein